MRHPRTYTNWENRTQTNNRHTTKNQYNRRKHGKNTEGTIQRTHNQENKHAIYKCPTCKYDGEEEHHLENHRRMKPSCKEQWKKERQNGWKCEIPEFGQYFPTIKQLQRHNQFYCHAQTQQQLIINNKHIRKLDRRKQLQEGIPQNVHILTRNNIKYNTDTNTWECRKCPKTYEKQSMRNAIQHAWTHTENTQQINTLIWKKEQRKKNKRTCVEYEHYEITIQKPKKTKKTHPLNRHNNKTTYKTTYKNSKQNNINANAENSEKTLWGILGYIKKQNDQI